MSSIILKHHGTLADYIGDAIFAFWNAPARVVRHPSVACEVALLQQTLLSQLEQKWDSEGLPPLKTRIGIHKGTVLCGNIGSRERFKYTMIGDAVNLASRLGNSNFF